MENKERQKQSQTREDEGDMTTVMWCHGWDLEQKRGHDCKNQGSLSKSSLADSNVTMLVSLL